MDTKKLVAWVLVVGALNWGLVGLLGLNVVESVLGGAGSLLTKLVYIVVGLAGVYKLYMLTMGKK
ncbi:MAG: hypothetical protein G01um10147_1026 [Microgenomates group bacterium Gr01-1014_7]|nr:MAG: hypothetical protein G01um10147_1026 [Microgenomates group bacterium Gr01-1014_7]